MKFILAVILMQDFSSTQPDQLQARQLFDDLSDCWVEAEALHGTLEGESVVVCLPVEMGETVTVVWTAPEVQEVSK